jgi:hypothetical protein
MVSRDGGGGLVSNGGGVRKIRRKGSVQRPGRALEELEKALGVQKRIGPGASRSWCRRRAW